MIVANFGNRSYDSYALGFPRAGDWRVRFNSDWQGYSADFGNQLGYNTSTGDGSRDGMPFQANVGVGPLLRSHLIAGRLKRPLWQSSPVGNNEKNVCDVTVL